MGARLVVVTLTGTPTVVSPWAAVGASTTTCTAIRPPLQSWVPLGTVAMLVPETISPGARVGCWSRPSIPHAAPADGENDTSAFEGRYQPAGWSTANVNGVENVEGADVDVEESAISLKLRPASHVASSAPKSNWPAVVCPPKIAPLTSRVQTVPFVRLSSKS